MESPNNISINIKISVRDEREARPPSRNWSTRPLSPPFPNNNPTMLLIKKGLQIEDITPEAKQTFCRLYSECFHFTENKKILSTSRHRIVKLSEWMKNSKQQQLLMKYANKCVTDTLFDDYLRFGGDHADDTTRETLQQVHAVYKQTYDKIKIEMMEQSTPDISTPETPIKASEKPRFTTFFRSTPQTSDNKSEQSWLKRLGFN